MVVVEPAPRAILFDWDDTLVDNWAAIGDALNAAFGAMGREPWTHSETRRRARKSLRDSFPEMFGELWEEARDIFYESFAANHLGTLSERPGASVMLEALHGAGLFMAVISNKRGDFLRREAEHLGWNGYFGNLVGAGDAAADKPDAAPVIMALARSGGGYLDRSGRGPGGRMRARAHRPQHPGYGRVHRPSARNSHR